MRVQRILADDIMNEADKKQEKSKQILIAQNPIKLMAFTLSSIVENV